MTAVPARDAAISGPNLFARYAYPPNTLGYCGPEDSQALLEYADAGVTDGGLVDLARGFEGAWPYLELIAGASGISDPLDGRVVEAYWIGNPLLERVDATLLGSWLADRFRQGAGALWSYLVESVPAGGLPHHSFHVFAVYPWVGLLRSGQIEEPLRILDRCRIRWGQVQRVDRQTAEVQSLILKWRGGRLEYGPPRLETVTHSHDGKSLSEIKSGDWVAMHWDWVCGRLDRVRLESLKRYSRLNMEVVNRTSTASAVG